MIHFSEGGGVNLAPNHYGLSHLCITIEIEQVTKICESFLLKVQKREHKSTDVEIEQK